MIEFVHFLIPTLGDTLSAMLGAVKPIPSGLANPAEFYRVLAENQAIAREALKIRAGDTLMPSSTDPADAHAYWTMLVPKAGRVDMYL